jgi:hypothetical protein
MTGPTPMVSTDGLIQCVEQSWTPPVLFHAVILGNLRMLQIYFLHTKWCNIGVDTYLNEQREVLAYLLPWRGIALQLVVDVMHVQNECLNRITYLEGGYNSFSVKAKHFQHKHVHGSRE